MYSVALFTDDGLDGTHSVREATQETLDLVEMGNNVYPVFVWKENESVVDRTAERMAEGYPFHLAHEMALLEAAVEW
jgi:hypothetical protein